MGLIFLALILASTLRRWPSLDSGARWGQADRTDLVLTGLAFACLLVEALRDPHWIDLAGSATFAFWQGLNWHDTKTTWHAGRSAGVSTSRAAPQ